MMVFSCSIILYYVLLLDDFNKLQGFLWVHIIPMAFYGIVVFFGVRHISDGLKLYSESVAD
jgi:hypothetical protein